MHLHIHGDDIMLMFCLVLAFIWTVSDVDSVSVEWQTVCIYGWYLDAVSNSDCE